MLAGLLLTSISTLTMRAALFQRKARTGWLEELDGIRGDALVSPEGTMDQVVDADDIWTDLREGGSYEDPHEISSLYATDETPDLPAPKPKAKTKARKARPEPTASVVDAPLPPPPPISELPPPPPAAAPPMASPEPQVQEVAAMAPVDEVPMGTDVGGPQDAEPVWVQPAPHPIRPSEMWHPAELAPHTLGDEVAPLPVEEQVASAELHEVAATDAVEDLYVVDHEPIEAELAPVVDDYVDPTYAVVDLAPEPAIDHIRASELESELVAAADLTVLGDAGLHPIDTPSEGGLVPGPVGRRVRRDRPALPQDQVPMADAYEMPAGFVPAISPDRGEQSPLPEPSLPPAALPTRAADEPAAALPSAAEVEHPVAAEVAPIPEVAAEEPAPVEPAPAQELVAGTDGLLPVPGTIARLAASAQATAALDADGAHVALASGWAWVSPGEGTPLAVHLELPTALATVTPGSTALAVVEAGDATFVFVADGTVELRRPDGVATLGRGSIAMLDPTGAAQVDQATDAELAADPVVAENLALDAEL